MDLMKPSQKQSVFGINMHYFFRHVSLPIDPLPTWLDFGFPMYRSGLADFGAVSRKSMTTEVFFRWECISISPPPPIPVIWGSAKLRHRVVEIAASMAFPPWNFFWSIYLIPLNHINNHNFKKSFLLSVNCYKSIY